MNTWRGVAPCPHSHLYMHGTRECGECWMIRFDAWWQARFPDEDEGLPFSAPVNDESYAPDAMYGETETDLAVAR